MVAPIRIAIIGLGKIARDQHLPAIEKSDAFELACAVDPFAEKVSAFPVFASITEAIVAGAKFDAVTICTPPQPRPVICEEVLKTRRAILLEKPPAATLTAARELGRAAEAAGVTLFAAWHSRFSPHIAAAREWMQSRTLKSGQIEWRENPKKWHPGQEWLWQEGGFGVFDPGINALSILTEIAPRDWQVMSARFSVPRNSSTPLAADLLLVAETAKMAASFEFHQRSDEVWTIRLQATNGDVLELSDGGTTLSMNNGQAHHVQPNEYDRVYKRFAQLVHAGWSDCDLTPLTITEQAFRIASLTPAPAQDF
jgi:D-galactose 1-dehydrogenase